MGQVGTSEAAKRLGCTPAWVAELIRRGDLKAVQVGRTWIIDERDLKDFAKIKRPLGRPSKKK